MQLPTSEVKTTPRDAIICVGLNGWDNAAHARLRTLWDEGHSTAEIARRMGTSKNSIVGKAHRLRLPSRPSPINRTGLCVRRPPSKRQRGVSLPPLAALKVFEVTQAAAPIVIPDVVCASAPPVGTRLHECCWPIGDPGTRGFRICEAVTLRAPYCDEHRARAYVKRVPKYLRTPNPASLHL